MNNATVSVPCQFPPTALGNGDGLRQRPLMVTSISENVMLFAKSISALPSNPIVFKKSSLNSIDKGFLFFLI